MAEKSTSAPDYIPKKGERALSIGMTGSGKTLFNRWLLERLPDSPIVVYDTKHDAKFLRLPKSRVVHSIDQAEEALSDLGVDYVIFRPDPRHIADAGYLDSLLAWHEQYWHHIGVYVDEIYQFLKAGVHSGPGLIGLFTRGRSRGITTVISTQRPANVSKFIFSEANLFYVFWLSTEDDRKRVQNFIPGFKDLAAPERFHFYTYRQGSDAPPRLEKPIPVAEDETLGYTDDTSKPEVADSDQDDGKLPGVNVWI